MANPPSKRPYPFFIENLLSNDSSPPPSRRFMIDQLLATDNQTGSGKAKLPEKYVEMLDRSVMQNQKFKFGKVRSRFSITTLPDDPETLLSGIFSHCIEDAIKSCTERVGEKPDHVGCLVTSKLLDTPIYTPIRPINKNNAEAVLNFFMKVAQSKKQNGITLWGEPFEVTVTTVNWAQLPKEQEIVGGSNHREGPVHNLISERSLIKVNNRDGRCLFIALQATLMSHVAGMPAWKFGYYLNSKHGQRGLLEQHVEELMLAVGAPLDLDKYNAKHFMPKVIDKWNNDYAGRFKFKCFIFSSLGRYKPILKHGLDDYNVPILLYRIDEHFHGVHKTCQLFGKPYCLSCEHCYNRPKTHSATCKARCIKCSRMGPGYPCKPQEGYEKHCKRCGKTFMAEDCYRSHLQSGFCNQSKQCDNCHIIYDVKRTRNGRSGHVCFEFYCSTCQDYHDRKRGCYIMPLEPKPSKEPYRFVAFDMETTQHQPVDDDPQRRQHVPNFIAAKVVCPDCISNGKWKESLRGDHQCKVCGNNRTITFSERAYHETTVDEQIITQQPVADFVDWILYKLPTKYDTYAYSHYGGKFDNVLVFKELFAKNFNPEMIRRGNKLFELKVRAQKGSNPKVVFRDSYNLVPTSLASLVPTFGLDVVEKPFFPHMANRPENYGRPIILTESDYLAAGMMPGTRAKFDAWFAEHRHEPFLLDEALASYCMNDVDILMAGLIAFRAEFLEVSKRPAVTADGKADRAFYKTPHNGIDVLRDCMTIASACMKHFRTNHLAGRKLAIVSDRGYDHADNQSLLAFRFLHWYGEEKQLSIQDARSPEGEKKIGNYKLDGWVEDGDNSYGIEVHGRTGPLKVFHAVKLGEKISYYDVTSLYPFINFITYYPIGHPKLHVFNKPKKWTKPEHNPYPMAIIKAFVVPPRKNILPVLPARVDDRLLFPLGMRCARKHPEGAVKANYSCRHNDRARGWVTTCTSLELNVALAKGYKVLAVYRVLEYTEWDNGIFKPYMREFIKQKIEASGFEKGIAGDAEAEAQFIKECYDLFGIQLDQGKMALNKGKRAIAKLAVNNLWGRFSLRNGLTQSLVSDDPAEWGKILADKSIELDSIDELNPGTVLIGYQKKKEWVEEHACSNIVISLFTTSAARLHLLEAMEKVVDAPGCTLLYTDTDSLIFAHPENANPLSLGPHLGDLTDEFPEHEIIEYVSGGCKQYGLKLRRKDGSGAEEYVLKIRGMTLSHDVINGQNLRYQTFKDKVLKFAETGGQPQTIEIKYPNFLKPSVKDGSVVSVPFKKIYRPFIGKGILDPSTFDVLNFGHIAIKPEPIDE